MGSIMKIYVKNYTRVEQRNSAGKGNGETAGIAEERGYMQLGMPLAIGVS